MKTYKKTLLVSALLMNSTILLAAQGGVEWGNAEDGFTPELKKMELPFKEPIVVTPRYCHLEFHDGLNVADRFKIDENKNVCVYGNFSKKTVFGTKKTPQWNCNYRGNIEYAVEGAKTELGMVTVCNEKNPIAYNSLSSFEKAFSFDSFSDEERKCLPDFSIQKDRLASLTLRRGDKKVTLEVFDEQRNWDLGYSLLGSPPAKFSVNFSSEFGLSAYEMSESLEEKYNQGFLSIFSYEYSCNLKYQTEHKESAEFLFKNNIKLSSNDKKIENEVKDYFNNSPAKTLLNIKSYAQVLNDRLLNEDLAKKLKLSYEDLNSKLGLIKNDEKLSYFQYSVLSGNYFYVTEAIE